MRILGIDYGDVRTGVAITDPLGITAQGLKTINNQKIVESGGGGDKPRYR